MVLNVSFRQNNMLSTQEYRILPGQYPEPYSEP